MYKIIYKVYTKYQWNINLEGVSYVIITRNRNSYEHNKSKPEFIIILSIFSTNPLLITFIF